MPTASTSLPIHQIAVGRAFGRDREKPAVPGRVIGLDGDRLINGSAVEIPGEPPQPSWLLFRCREEAPGLVTA